MRKLNIKKVALAVTIAVTAVGCGKFLDVNDSPNQPLTADVKLLLPSAQAATAHVLSNQFGITGGLWSQYWTQNPFSSQYRNTERYTIQPSTSNSPWAILYAGALQDYKRVIENAGSLNQHAAIALVMRAYTYQMITDAWGDVPLKDALNEGVSLNIPYQSQKVVYDSIFLWLDRGLAILNPSSPNKVGGEDLVFGGNINQWIRFANTLKLRAYLRLSGIDATRAETGVKSLEGKPLLSSSAAIQYATTGGNENPLFSEILGLGRTQNLVASNTFLDAMKANKDPRLKQLYTTVTYDGVEDTVIGNRQGNFTASPDFDLSFPSAATGGLGADNNSATAPVVLISEAESYFLQSEARARGWFTAGSAQTLFNNGITASFEANKIGAQAAAYIASATAAQWPGSMADQIKAIITQKYFAMNGWQTFEAWTEWRRTGYPDFFVLSSNQGLSGKFPVRLPYPETEANTNGEFGNVKHRPNSERLWWDIAD
ncbi:SusD/RagB family nutrient-binding outer membrane lipoprotein [Chitinophaga rhizosphaerae]|uniref:SusD/RagB family nutrient-binding outer membrane lipoprotein n=1 Tax=Chitinophaga rhizosphaerae TaxID=1864947 RepID=UPI000F80614D|nr:SusD/RagB family nutrient-binding outer membrane lipoprotein [Chitinophaga rhizosphaerae]